MSPVINSPSGNHPFDVHYVPQQLFAFYFTTLYKHTTIGHQEQEQED